MIQEDYVDFELAKKLKEAGFPQIIGALGDQFTDDPTVYHSDGEYYNKPTLSLVTKWLREKHGIVVTVRAMRHVIVDTDSVFTYQYTIQGKKFSRSGINGSTHNTYEEALSAGIDKALEILELQNKICTNESNYRTITDRDS